MLMSMMRGCMLQASASGMYLVEKLDLLVAYTIAVPLAKWLSQYFPKVWPLR